MPIAAIWLMAVQLELSKLFGRRIQQVRKTKDNRISAIDVAAALTGKNHRAASKDVMNIRDRHPELKDSLHDYKFPGKRQRDTPVCDVRALTELVFLLPGKHAARVRRQAAEIFCRWLGGDLSIIEEVCRNRGIQAELAARQPEHPLRPFGEDVEQKNDASSLDMANICQQMLEHVMPEILQKITKHIDERFITFETPLCNRRSAPYVAASQQNAQPLSIPKFLSEKESDNDFKKIRAAFASTFTILVSILYKESP